MSWTDKTEKEKRDWSAKMIAETGLVPFRAWMIMLALGALHSEWSTAVPPLSYWACIILILASIAAVHTFPLLRGSKS